MNAGFDTLYRHGRFLDIWRALSPEQHQHLTTGLTADDSVFYVRLLNQLGLSSKADWLTRKLWRLHPQHPHVWYLEVLRHCHRRRIFDAFELADQRPPLPQPFDQMLAASIDAELAGQFRDFETAQRAIDTGLQHCPGHEWLLTDQCMLLYRQDRLDAALETCDQYAAGGGSYFPIESWRSFLLHQRNRGEEGLTAYAAVNERCQSPRIAAGHANCLFELKRPAEGRAVLERLFSDYPMFRDGYWRGFHHRMVSVCRELGDDSAALRHARLAGPHSKSLVERLESPDPGETGRRVQLDVPFVRQDHLTCVPATLSSILAFLGHSVDQRAIAEQITYDGTSDFLKKTWCEQNGYRVRFFSFDETTARDLIDRQLPFSIATRYPGGAHAQAVIGYDTVLDTWLLREPGIHAVQEVAAKSIRETVAARGGSCSLIVPMESAAARRSPETLPDEEAQGRLVMLEEALHEQRTDDAQLEFARLRELHEAGHIALRPVWWDAARLMAYAHANPTEQLRLWREQHAAFPEDPYCAQHLAAKLFDCGLWTEHRLLLEAQFRKPVTTPMLSLELADLWAVHRSKRPLAQWLIKSAARSMGDPARALSSMAGLLWRQRESQSAALLFYRLATISSPYDENLAMACFRAYDELARGEEGLDYLRQRRQSLGTRRADPAGTLARALQNRHRPTEAIELLREALRHEDNAWATGILIDLLYETAQLDEVQRLLATNQTKMTRARYLNECLRLHEITGDHDAFDKVLDEALLHNPHDYQHWSRKLDRILVTGGRDAAIAEAIQLADRQRDWPRVVRVAYDFLWRQDVTLEAEKVARQLVASHEGETWLLGLLGQHLVFAGRVAEGLELIKQVLEVTPDSTACLNDLAIASLYNNDLVAVRDACRRSLALDANQVGTIVRLLQSATGQDEARDDLQFIADQFLQRRPDSDSLRRLMSLSERSWSKPEQRHFLERLEQEYPGDPDVAEALVEFLIESKEYAAAERSAARLCEQFAARSHPFRLRVRALRAMQRSEDAATLLREYQTVRPHAHWSYLELGELLEESGELDEAARLYERALLQNPGHAPLHGFAADLAWRRGDSESALRSISKACELDASYSWAWVTRCVWLCDLDRQEEALEIARDHVSRSPLVAAAHDTHARMLQATGDHEGAIEALRHALRLDPQVGDARQRLVRTLGQLGRFDEASAAVEEGLAVQGDSPALLREQAKIRRLRGDHAGATRDLRILLDRHSDDIDSWLELLTWLDSDGRNDEIIKLYEERERYPSLREMPALSGYAADAYRNSGNRAAAMAAFRTACDLSPRYEWARSQLADMLHQDKRYKEEADVLAPAKDPDAVGAAMAARIVRSAVRSRDPERATRFYRRVLRDPDVSDEWLHNADQAMRTTRDREKIIAAAAKDYRQETVRVNLLRLDARNGSVKNFEAGLAELTTTMSFAPSQMATLMSTASDSSVARQMARWCRKNEERLLEHADTWGQLLLAYNRRGKHDQVVAAGMPHFRRPGAAAWMLAQLSNSLVCLNRYDEVAEVCSYALGLPRDHSWWWHRTDLAYCCYQRGDYAAALDLAQVPVSDAWFPRLLGNAIEAMVDLQQQPSPAKSRRRVFRRHLPRLLWTWQQATAAEGTVDQNRYVRQTLLGATFKSELTWLFARKFGRTLLRLRYGAREHLLTTPPH